MTPGQAPTGNTISNKNDKIIPVPNPTTAANPPYQKDFIMLPSVYLTYHTLPANWPQKCYNQVMVNWSTDEASFRKKDPAGYRLWRITQLINYGLDGEKLNKDEVKQAWPKIKNK